MTMTNAMRQIQIAEYGSPTVLTSINTEMPVPQAGELLIRVEAAGVNYSDVLRRKNIYFMPTPLPYVLGAEAVGEIVKIGDGAPSPPFQLGSRVLAILPFGGGYAEYVTANAQYCVSLPPQIDAKVATALFVQGSTAHLLLHQVAGNISGKTLLIHAAAGGVGSLLIQLAKLAGANVIAASSSDEKLQFAQKMGADLSINYAKPDWTNRLIQENKGKKVDIILETVGGAIYTQSFACLRPGGTIIVYGSASGERGYIHSEHFVDESQNLLSFNLAHFIQNRADVWQASLGAMIGLIAEGKIKVQTASTYALKDVVQAHQDLENRQTTGKVVLIP